MPSLVPVEFLLSASPTSLGDFVLARLATVANLRKQMSRLREELLKADAEALFAGWLIEHRSELLELGRTDALQKTLDFAEGTILQGPGAVLRVPQHRRVDAAD